MCCCNPLLVGFMLVWMSVFVLPIGTYYKLTSPQYMEWAAIEMQPEALRAQMIFGKSEDVSFTFCFYLGIAMIFTAGTIVVHVMNLWRRDVGLLAAGAFGIGCLFGAVLGIAECASGFGWGFNALGVGYLMATAGLILGAIGLVRQSLVASKKQVCRADIKVRFLMRMR